MTIAEIHASILLKIDRIGSYSTANLIPGEIDDFVNQAIRDYVTQQQTILRTSRDSAQSSVAQENLRTIIETEEITSNINSHPFLDNVFTADLSDLTDYDYFVSGRALFDEDYKMLRPVSSSFIIDDEKSEYDDPFSKGIPAAIEDDEIVSRYPVNASGDPDSVIINYCQVPEETNYDPNTPGNSVNTDLPDRTHRDIVDIAVSKILSSLSGQEPNREGGGEEQ